MTLFKFVRKSISFYWRSNLAVLAAVIVSAAVLAGALVVGDCVEHSLKMMIEARLGGTELALFSQDRFFTTSLADKLAVSLNTTAAPVLQLRGLMTNSDGTKRANRIELLGVDARFYETGASTNPFPAGQSSGVILNESLAAKIGVKTGDEVVLRISKPSLMPREIPLTPEADLSVGFRLVVTDIILKISSFVSTVGICLSSLARLKSTLNLLCRTSP